MTFSEFLAEIKSSFKQYDSANLIEDVDIHTWVIEGMKRFGNLSTIPTVTVIKVNNRKAELPEGFKNLRLALKCDACGYECDEEDEDILISDYFYKTTSTTDITNNICNPCNQTVKESFVEERVYLRNGKKAKMYYNDLKWLKLVSYLKNDVDFNECLNLKIKESPYEISINNGVLYTNFTKGLVYIVYNGFEIGEDGFIIIPDSSRGHLKSYLEYYCKRKLMERLVESADATNNEMTLLQYYTKLEMEHFVNAKTDLKFKDMNLAIEGYKESLENSRFKMYNFGL